MGEGRLVLEFSVVYRSVLVLSSFCTSKLGISPSHQCCFRSGSIQKGHLLAELKKTLRAFNSFRCLLSTCHCPRVGGILNSSHANVSVCPRLSVREHTRAATPLTEPPSPSSPWCWDVADAKVVLALLVGGSPLPPSTSHVQLL